MKEQWVLGFQVLLNDDRIESLNFLDQAVVRKLMDLTTLLDTPDNQYDQSYEDDHFGEKLYKEF